MQERIFTKAQLVELATRLMRTGGLREEDAVTIANDLIKADMRGLYSHGISRIPMYLKRIDCNCVKPAPEIKVERVAPAVLRVNGDDGMGFLVAHKAMEEGMKLADETGIAMVGCTHSTHFGMSALYVKQAIDNGYACMVYTNSSPALPVFGGRTTFLGAAPFAAGLPGGYESPGYVLGNGVRPHYVIYYHLPVTGGGDTPESPDAVAGTYLLMLDEQMDKIIHTIMDAESNVLYFCGAGKDRTGVVSAVILKKLGYSDQAIIDDYMETKDNLMRFLISYVEEHPEVDLNTIIPNEENIKRVLEAI